MDIAAIPAGVSVVVPVYNGARTLRDLVAGLGAVLPQEAERFEVILVNDGSRDESWEVTRELAREHKWVRGINLMRNYGQHNALLCGIRAARYDVIVTLDDDLQHPPTEVPRLLAKLREGHDVVYGISRSLPHSWWRNLLSRYIKRTFAKATGLDTIRDISAFRAFKTRIRRAFADFRGPQLILDVLLAWSTTCFGSVEVDLRPRQAGKSNYNFARLFNQTMLLLTGFSTGPLRLATYVGFGFTLLGMLVLVYVVGRYFAEGSLPGFPFLASIIALFSGAQLFTLGIFGEYLGRIFTRSLERPTYVVDEITNLPLDSPVPHAHDNVSCVTTSPGHPAKALADGSCRQDV